MNKEISIIIKNIKKKNIDYQDIPLELRNNIDIIEAERKSGMRVYSHRGYDVIFNRFFVQEYIMDFSNNSILETIITNFELFDDYYEYLKGNIYEKSCYYQCEFTSRQVKKYKIDVNKIKNNAFIDYTIADDSLDNELENLHAEFKNAELKKEKNKLWINKVLDCKNLKELIKAELVTKFPDLGGNIPEGSDGFQGAVSLKRISPDKEIGELKLVSGGETSNIEQEENTMDFKIFKAI